LIDFQGRSLEDIGPELRAESCHVGGEERDLVAGSGDGDVGEPRVEQDWMNFSIGVHENSLGSQALGTVAGEGVAVVEMTILAGVEFDLAVVVEAGGKAAVGIDCFDEGEVAIGNAKRFVGGSKLDVVAYGKLAFDLLVDADAGEAAGIVGRKFVVRFLEREQVCGWVDRDDRCTGGSLNSDGFAAPSVANPRR
jgi:hypothetical protein